MFGSKESSEELDSNWKVENKKRRGQKTPSKAGLYTTQHLLSANSKSSLVVVRSADSTTLDFFLSAISKSFFTTG